MQTNWQLEELTLGDYEAALRLWNESPGVNANETPEEFARILARNPGMSFSARLEGRLIGAVFCGHDGHRGFLYHLAVEPAYRRLGIAKVLVERCLVRLAEEGIRRCSIHVFRDNDEGSAFWLRTGWRERPNVLVMSKDLSSAECRVQNAE